MVESETNESMASARDWPHARSIPTDPVRPHKTLDTQNDHDSDILAINTEVSIMTMRMLLYITAKSSKGPLRQYLIIISYPASCDSVGRLAGAIVSVAYYELMHGSEPELLRCNCTLGCVRVTYNNIIILLTYRWGPGWYNDCYLQLGCNSYCTRGL